MADSGNKPVDNFKAHAETFAGFTSLMTWGTIGSALVGAFVVFLIAQ